jgi:hypothetical protein
MGGRVLAIDRHPLVGGLACIAIFGAAYLIATAVLGVGETRLLVDRLRRRSSARRR